MRAIDQLCESLAGIYVHRARVELDLRNQPSRIIPDEFNTLYAMLTVGIHRTKDSSRAEKKVALRLLDSYVDGCLVPLFGLNTTARKAASHLKFRVGKRYFVSPAGTGKSRFRDATIPKERLAYLNGICLQLGSTILDMAGVVTLAELDLEFLKAGWEGTQQIIAMDESLQDSVRNLALEYLTCEVTNS
jgi:hypothetical protein